MVDFKRLTENLTAIRERIASAAKRSGRSAGEIRMVAVTKYVDAEIALALIAAGCHELGESRPQELWAKADALKSEAAMNKAIRWHLIGHLQRNKIERTLPLVSLIHSGDSVRLLQAVSAAVAKTNHAAPVLLEINISGESTKHGFSAAEIERDLETITEMRSVEVRGLMCMASREGDIDQARREFAALRELRDRLSKIANGNIKPYELSMGMSGDFEAAIEEGATIVRIGSALFDGIE